MELDEKILQWLHMLSNVWIKKTAYPKEITKNFLLQRGLKLGRSSKFRKKVSVKKYFLTE